MAKKVAKLHENRHHLLWMGKNWKKGYYSRRLRESLVFWLKVEVHNELHKNCESVPVLDEETCKDLLARIPRLDAYETALWLIQEVGNQGFKTAITHQLPYLRGGTRPL